MDEFTQERYPGVTRAELERERRARPLRRHVFVPTGRRSYGHRICATCDGLERDSVHKVPERTDEERAHEQRKVGESSG